MTTQALIQVVIAWAGLAAIFTGLWLIQQKRRDASLVDVGWAAGIGLAALFYAAALDAALARRVLTAAMTCAWSFRLALYLFFNRVAGKPEDGRYQRLRADWGDRAARKFFVFFQAQAVTVVILSLSPLTAMLSRRPLGVLDAAAGLLLVASVGGEALADAQLARFRADPANKGRTCRLGLWGWSRHPNYFFEWLHWLVYVVLAVGSPAWWVTLVAPVLILYVLLRVTGIPATEAQALASRGDDYRAYQRTTSAFVPLPPRKGAP